MISTAAQVKTRVRALLDDPAAQTFTDAIILEGYGEAIDALQSAFVLYQIPRAKAVSTYGLAANITSVTPATAGIADFGELIHLEERLFGSSDKFTPVWEVDNLPQRIPVERLGEFEWRGDTFWFVGSTQARELRFSYFSTVEQPTDLSGSTGVDGAKTFLSKYTAGIIAPRKGYNELGEKYMGEAVGPKYALGVIGGELYRLILPMVRGMQRVQVAPHPFSAFRRMGIRRAVPYVAAQSVNLAPSQFSTSSGSITGVIDGINAAFTLIQTVSTIEVFRNGIRMTLNIDFTWSGPSPTFVFAGGQIPQIGDVISANGWT